MAIKRVVVTGANSGMGKAIAVEMAKRGYEVIMLCRDEKRGHAALREVKKLSGSTSVSLELCDLASFESILRCTKRLSEKYEWIDCMINNAGVILTKRYETEDGFEMQIGVNHFGHFLLTKELLPLIKNASEGRIVVVSSGAHKVGKIHFDDLQLTKGYHAFKAYAQSKLANLLYVKAMAEVLKGTGITINALHPGAVGTNMGVNRETGFGKGIMSVLSKFFLSPEEGAQTSVYLAVSPDVKGLSGGYYYKQKLAKTAKIAQNKEVILKFYQLSNTLVEEKKAASVK